MPANLIAQTVRTFANGVDATSRGKCKIQHVMLCHPRTPFHVDKSKQNRLRLEGMPAPSLITSCSLSKAARSYSLGLVSFQFVEQKVDFFLHPKDFARLGLADLFIANPPPFVALPLLGRLPMCCTLLRCDSRDGRRLASR